MRDAAEAAGAAEFISELPAGYETTVGDGGRPLSAGETSGSPWPERCSATRRC